MNKEKFLNRLKELKLLKTAKPEFDTLNEFGINHSFKWLSKEEAVFASKYLRRYPNAYYLAFFKYILGISPLKRIEHYTMDIKEVMWEYHRYFYHQYVGPFFYIDGKIKGLRIDITDANINDHFINSPVSHFDYFNFLGIDDDYGHYPRGRVIYDNSSNEFIVYIDKSLIKNKEVIDMVMARYNLCSYNTVIKTDEHYTHDNL